MQTTITPANPEQLADHVYAPGVCPQCDIHFEAALREPHGTLRCAFCHAPLDQFGTTWRRETLA